MTTVERPRSAADVLERARALAPAVADRAAETEAARRVPADLLAALVDAGCFRILLPASHGGAEADVATAFELVETIAAADASTGWVVALGAGAWRDLTELPRATFDAVFARPEVRVAGVFSPTGSIEAADGGYHLSGRWAFASGCEDADWLYLNAVEDVVDGVPHLRAAVVSRNAVVVEDTWRVAGLRGTGSHHVHVDGVQVPADRTFVPLTGNPCVDTPAARIPVPSLFGLGLASVAVGCAQGALDDLTGLAAGKVPLLASSSLATSAWFRHALATADTELRAARTLVRDHAARAWDQAAAGEPFTLLDVARMRAAAAWAADRAAAVVDTAQRAGGGTAVYDDCTLSRRHRDAHAITQHFLVRPDTMGEAGAVLTGGAPAVPVF